MTEAEMVAELMTLGWNCKPPVGAEVVVTAGLDGTRHVAVLRPAYAAKPPTSEHALSTLRHGVIVDPKQASNPIWKKRFPGWDIVGAGWPLAGRRYDRLLVAFGLDDAGDQILRTQHQQWLDEAAATRLPPGCVLEWVGDKSPRP